MTVAARGINATVVEKDIGTINGVVHVIDRILGVPYQSVYQRLSTDPNLSHFWSLLVQTHLDRLFTQNNATTYNDVYDPYTQSRGPKFTLVVPSNAAWEKAQMNFHKAYNTLLDGQFPQYVRSYQTLKITRHDKSSFFRRLAFCKDTLRLTSDPFHLKN